MPSYLCSVRYNNAKQKERNTMRTITSEHLASFTAYLHAEEHAPSTIEKYCRDVRSFAHWLNGGAVTKESAAAWKAHLRASGRAPVTVNALLAAVNRFFRSTGWEECRVKYLTLQRRLFRESRRELTRKDYEKLYETAQKTGRLRLALLMETLAATGIRISELKYITVQAARTGRTDIHLKGKVRTILLPNKLCRKLLKYAKQQKIASGEIFLTKGGKGISRKQVWAELKALSRDAGVEPDKVFPHNLRHLFAVAFYKVCRDIVRLADVLGHTSVETTRIYLLSTGGEHLHALEQLRFVQ